MNIKLLPTLATLLFAVIAQGADPSPSASAPAKSQIDPGIITQLVGQWKNDLGSTLNITAIDSGTGAMTGTYTSPSGGGGTPFALVGWVNTAPIDPKAPSNVTVVSFSVSWGTFGSVTAWNGYYNAKSARIIGQWLLSRANSQFIWDHILTGQDQFTKQ